MNLENKSVVAACTISRDGDVLSDVSDAFLLVYCNVCKIACDVLCDVSDVYL